MVRKHTNMSLVTHCCQRGAKGAELTAHEQIVLSTRTGRGKVEVLPLLGSLSVNTLQRCSSRGPHPRTHLAAYAAASALTAASLDLWEWAGCGGGASHGDTLHNSRCIHGHPRVRDVSNTQGDSQRILVQAFFPKKLSRARGQIVPSARARLPANQVPSLSLSPSSRSRASLLACSPQPCAAVKSHAALPLLTVRARGSSDESSASFAQQLSSRAAAHSVAI